MKTIAYGALFLLMAAGSVSADFISGVALSSPAATLNSASFSPLPPDQATAALYNNNSLSGFLNIDLDLNQIHTPFNVNISTLSTRALFGPAGPPPGAAANYVVNVTVNNMLSNNKPFQGFNLEALTNGAVFTGGNPGADFDNPLSTNNPPYATNYLSPSNIFFGGLNGGGGFTPNGTSTTFSFVISISGSTGASSAAPLRGFTLQMTANPEPGSLALAMVLGGPAVMFFRRKRAKAIVESTSAV